MKARKVFARLMMAASLPKNELENPDWIDSYTFEPDGDYTYLKVKEPGFTSEASAVSSDGKMPKPSNNP